jgi:hypothetical protein
VKPLASLSADDVGALRALTGLLFDLDDTLLSHGVLTRAAYDALWDLKGAGVRLVAVTGRPSGWGEVIARQWPIDGAVTENGAVVIAREGRDGKGIARYERCDESERRTRRARLARIIDDVRALVPEARLTDDLGARRADVTWDIGERVRLPGDRVSIIAAAIAAAGARSRDVRHRRQGERSDSLPRACVRRGRRRGHGRALGVCRR